MRDGLARLLAVLLITAAAYILVAVIPWRIMEEYAVHRFFGTAKRYAARRADPEQTTQAVAWQISEAIS
jgi:hypothetical protein